jgi:hypothetical protein
MLIPLNSDEKHGFFRSVAAKKADIRLQEIPAIPSLKLRGEEYPLLTIPERILWIDPMTVTG